MSENPQDGKQKRGRGGRGHGQPMTREVQISKAMSLLLRHAAEKEGLKMNAQGYASVADVVSPQSSYDRLSSHNSFPATMAEAQVHQSHLRRSPAGSRFL
jgi:RNA:NAD 2'-phosphotransferase (TPT1/KptA family)